MKRKHKIIASLVIGALALGLASCNNETNNDTSTKETETKGSETSQTTTKKDDPSNEKYVSFKVKDESGEWKDLVSPQIITNGKVIVPDAPQKDSYKFRGWFTDTKYDNEFVNDNLTESVTCYAYYVGDEVNVVFDGEAKGVRDLSDVLNGTYMPSVDSNLTFDGWYTNQECTVKYQTGDPAKTLYGQTVALVTFDNGYETCLEAKVKPNTKYSNPSVTKALDDDGNEIKDSNGNSLTVEQNNIVKSYMSEEDIFYVDENGEDIDFAQAISKNTKITVLWKSPFLKFQYSSAPQSNVLMCLGTYGSLCKASDYKKAKVNNVPVISFPSRVTRKDSNGNFIDKDGNILTDGSRDYVDVKQVYIYDNQIFNSTVLTSVIVQEGVEVIRGFSSVSGLSTVTSFKLPSSLRLIQDSFNNLNINENSVVIPEGVRGIYNSFWAKSSVNYNDESRTYYTGTTYDFNINIPSSVESLSIVPLNLKFNSTSSFYKENSGIYQNTTNGKVLVSYNFDLMNDGVITLGDDIKGIQVGTFVNRTDIKKLELSKELEFVNYNLNLSDFKDSYGWYSGKYTNNECYLYNDNLSEGDYAYNARLVVSDINLMDYLVFKNEPSDDLLEGFGGNENLAYSYGNFTLANNEIYKNVKVITQYETTTPSVYVTFNDTFSNEKYVITISRSNNDSISLSDILTKLDDTLNTNYLNVYQNNHLNVLSSTHLGLDYDYTNEINKNLYLIINTTYQGYSGVTYECVNGEIVVTGFDETTAVPMGDYYGIIIPSIINGLEVTSIKESAFENNALIKKVVMGENIKFIGENAFNGASSIENIDFNNAKIETIGDYAFQDVSVTTLKISLANLKSLGKYAFAIETLEAFEYQDGESSRTIENVKDGEFIIGTTPIINWSTYSYDYIPNMIYQRVSESTNSDGLKVLNVKLYTVTNNKSVTSINLGSSLLDSDYEPYALIYVEVMEGAITNVSQSEDYQFTLEFNYITKIHTNAITNSHFVCDGEKLVGFSNGEYSNIRNIDDLIATKPELFEENWFDNLNEILKNN